MKGRSPSRLRRARLSPYTELRVMLQQARVPVDRLFRAFSDRTRLRILHLLQDGEMCVCDLVGALKVPQPTASRHLAYLRRAGLVKVRKSASWSYYTLAEPRNGFHAKLLGCLSSCFDQVPELERDRTRSAKARRRKSCC
jgi:ArsR family transcriptional regulator